jgi:hypothetical protein
MIPKLRMIPEFFRGEFTIAFCRPGRPEPVIALPLGIYIHTINWSPQARTIPPEQA